MLPSGTPPARQRYRLVTGDLSFVGVASKTRKSRRDVANGQTPVRA